MTTKDIKTAFDKLVNDYGASSKLGLTAGQLYDYKRRYTVQKGLFVLWKAGKLKIVDDGRFNDQTE